MKVDDNAFEDWMNRLDNRINSMDAKLDKLIDPDNKLDSDDLLDNQDLMILMKISPRTLQRLRSTGVLPFKKINKKTYYLKSDVLKMLKSSSEK